MNFKIPNILLVEDDHLDVINVQRTLAKINLTHKLFVAKNGEEAMAMLKGDGAEKIPVPEIILLDINMPKMDGIEFLSILRSREELKEIKVFVITTSNEEIDREYTQRMSISGYIVKPLSLNSGNSKDSFSLLIDLMNLKTV